MTHPDPYIEEVMDGFDKYFAWVLSSGLHGIHLSKPIKDYFQPVIETQKSATKTQRIKDIEEIDSNLPVQFAASEESEVARGWNEAIASVRSSLTSRKAAIEEV